MNRRILYITGYCLLSIHLPGQFLMADVEAWQMYVKKTSIAASQTSDVSVYGGGR